ncbi:MAG: alpha/beta hydrolase [Tessaracoccus sp.]|uniref:alpha/beta fold hydrolase n=1 Tax=Tessaracoccus sp. TaxID=1971211 RepID=UPI001ED0746A|nr:alpha/beta hydrolase [Tessaracoccus sp.]MBK7821130.1 alpha/beta hydrolase [Tessaracoccus sp.]
MAADPTTTRDVGEAEIHIHEYGAPNPPALILVHGLTDDGTCWPDAVERWKDRWHILAVDQRGHGRSPKFTEEQLPDSSGVLVDDLLGILTRLAEPAIVVGHSLGGLIAARAATRAPELVRALVLEDPAKPREHWDGQNAEFARQQLAFVEAVANDPDRELARMLTETPWTETELDAWASSKALVDRGYLAGGLTLGDTAWESMFDALTVPTLILVPVDGEMAPDPALIANPLVAVVELPGVGHCIRRDDGEAYHAIVDPFLARHAR